MDASSVAPALAWSWAALYIGAVGRAVTSAQARARRAATDASAGAPHATRVTILRPCAGDEPQLAARLASLPLSARATGALRVVFAVAGEGDAAFPAAEEARRSLSAAGVDARTLVTGAVGPNRKADQLERALASLVPPPSPDERVVFADSDVELRAVDLAALLAPLRETVVGAAWAAPVESGARDTDGDTRSHAVLGATLHAFPLLGGLDPKGLVGKLFAVRGDVLAVAFAAPSLRRSIGEDHAIGERLARAGYRLVLAPVLARSQARGRSLEAVRERYHRWLLVVRAQRWLLLVSYPLLLAAGPSWLLLALLALAAGQRSVALATGAGLLARLAVAFAARHFTGSTLGAGATLVAAARGDLLLLECAARALVHRRIRWRDRELVVGTGGQLVDEGAAS